MGRCDFVVCDFRAGLGRPLAGLSFFDGREGGSSSFLFVKDRRGFTGLYVSAYPSRCGSSLLLSELRMERKRGNATSKSPSPPTLSTKPTTVCSKKGTDPFPVSQQTHFLEPKAPKSINTPYHHHYATYAPLKPLSQNQIHKSPLSPSPPCYP